MVLVFLWFLRWVFGVSLLILGVLAPTKHLPSFEEHSFRGGGFWWVLLMLLVGKYLELWENPNVEELLLLGQVDSAKAGKLPRCAALSGCVFFFTKKSFSVFFVV